MPYARPASSPYREGGTYDHQTAVANAVQTAFGFGGMLNGTRGPGAYDAERDPTLSPQRQDRERAVQERAAAAQQQELEKQRLALGAHLLKGEYSRQPAAFAQAYGPQMAELGERLLPSPQDDRLIMQKRQQEAVSRKAIEDFASQPHADQANIENLWHQHRQAFPDFAQGVPRPTTRAEQMQQQRNQKLSTYQQALPDVPLDFDHRGQIAVIPGYAEAQRAKVEGERIINERLHLESQARNAAYQRELRRLEIHEPRQPGVHATPEEVETFKQDRLAYSQAYRRLDESYFGAEPGAQQQSQAQPQQGSNATFDAYRQKAQAAGLAFVSDKDDYETLQPGQRYIDSEDGLTYEKK